MESTPERKKKFKTIYQQVAEKYGVTARYVGKIARSERKPTKKVGLEIKNELESLASSNN